MEFPIIRKGEATPHFPGPVRYIPTGKIYYLIGECPCTDWPLHYRVRLEDGNEMIVHHTEVEMICDEVGNRF